MQAFTEIDTMFYWNIQILSRMVLAALPAGIVYTFLWFVPPSFDEEPTYVKFIYYLCMYFAFQALLTVSFVALADCEP